MTTAILWLRQDLRLGDNPALRAACKGAKNLLIVFIDDPTDQTLSSLGAASRVWLHHSLENLQHDLSKLGQRLFCFQGNSEAVLTSLVQASGADRVSWNRCYDPVSMDRDIRIKSSLAKLTEVTSYNGLLIAEPWRGCKEDGSPYRVFTPYYRNLSRLLPLEPPLAAPRKLPQAIALKSLKGADWPVLDVADLELLPRLDWHQGVMGHWQVGERAARRQLKRFLASTVENYGVDRDIPSVQGTSTLSPHLHFGEISPRQIAHELYKARPEVVEKKSGSETFLKEVFWREFAYHLLYHFPHTVDQPLDKRFEKFPWPKIHTSVLSRWQQGRTGVPIVDAGMRQLWQSGWMHNRVRMIVASYLVKNLMIPWQQGERWFRDTLIDADLASNVMGWQWTAGCGADAAPYFRVFNPVLQGKKFDPDGGYVRTWVPELAKLDNKYIHDPWELDATSRASLDYPDPLVDLKVSRLRALDAFDKIKKPLAC